MNNRQSSFLMRLFGKAHGKVILHRRVRRLAKAIAGFLDEPATVIDLGCGDGQIGSLVLRHKDGVSLKGYDILVRPHTRIPVYEFDGNLLPEKNNAVDTVILVDVLHHCVNPEVLLREAYRVARHSIIIKDHYLGRPLAGMTLRFMDWVGNRAHGVVLPYNYWTEKRWLATWAKMKLRPVSLYKDLGLYPWPLNILFGYRLHFLAKLVK